MQVAYLNKITNAYKNKSKLFLIGETKGNFCFHSKDKSRYLGLPCDESYCVQLHVSSTFRMFSYIITMQFALSIEVQKIDARK